MNDNKGFTLVELLGVLVLIGLLIGIGVPGISKISKNIKQKSLNTKINQIEQAAALWGQNNKTTLQETECETKDGKTSCKKVSIKYLIEEDYLDSENYNELAFVNPIDDSNMIYNCVYIFKKNNRVYATYSKVELCEDSEDDNNPLKNMIHLRHNKEKIEQIDFNYNNSYKLDNLNVYLEQELENSKVKVFINDSNLILKKGEISGQSLEEIEAGEYFSIEEKEGTTDNYESSLTIETLGEIKVSKTYKVEISNNAIKLVDLIKSEAIYTTDKLGYTPGERCASNEEPTLLKDEDDYGYTYYFRGNPENNYVLFNNMCWRIVRILGNDTVKLILQNTSSTCSEDSESAYIAQSSYGYLYGDFSVSQYFVPYFYAESGSKYIFDASSYIGVEGAGYNLSIFIDMYFDEKTKAMLKKDSFKINGEYLKKSDNAELKEFNNVLNRDASFKSSINNVEPVEGVEDIVQLLTGDELAYAGASKNGNSCDFYLKNDKNTMLTLDMGMLYNYTSGNIPYIIPNPLYLNENGKLTYYNFSIMAGQSDGVKYGIRPVIVLDKDVLTKTFTFGTSSAPYEIIIE